MLKRKEKGITLIALVVTIVVLIILAVISINAVLGDNGIIRQAEKAREHQANAEVSDNDMLNELDEHLANTMSEKEEEEIEIIEPENIDDWEWVEENGGITLTKYSGNATELVIPNHINGKPVKKIGYHATAIHNEGTDFVFVSLWAEEICVYDYWDLWSQPVEQTTIKKVTIPEGIEEIDNKAFYGWPEDDDYEPKEDYFDENSVEFVSAITEIDMPSTITQLPDSLMERIENGNIMVSGNLNLPNYSTIDGVLFNKDKTTLIRYPKIKKGTEYQIPDSVTSIGYSAFSGCTGLTNITIPEGVTNIGDSAFSDCTGLTNITIPEGVTTIGKSAFYGCYNLANANYTGTETQWNQISMGIGNEYLLEALGKNETIELTPTDLKYFSFKYNTTARTAIITGIKEEYCPIATYYHEYQGSIERKIPLYILDGDNIITDVILPSSVEVDGVKYIVTGIGYSAFENISEDSDSEFTSFTIPKSITNIELSAFVGCNKLTKINYTGTQEQWNQINGNTGLTNVTKVYNYTGE